MEIIGFIVAIAICYFIGPYVEKLLDKATENIELVNPEGIDEKDWNRFIRPSGRVEGGKWLGILERILALFSVYTGAFIIIGGWLVFKVGSKWQIWANVVKMPDQLENVNDFSYLLARQRWGSWLLMRFLVGTLGNVLVGFVLACTLKWFMN